MKKKVTIGILSLVITLTTLGNLKAETETTGGGESPINCYKPDNNICAILHTKEVGEIKLKGVLYID